MQMQTYADLSDTEKAQVAADDMAIHLVLLGLPYDVFVTVDALESAYEVYNEIKTQMEGNDYQQQIPQIQQPSPNPQQQHFNQQPLKNNNENFFTDNQMFIPDTANMNSADSMNHMMAFLAKAFQRYYTTPTNNNKRIYSNPSIRAASQSYGNPGSQNYGNQGSQNYVGDRIRVLRRDYQYLKEHMLLAKKEESGVPLTDDEYGLLAHAAAAEEDEEEDLLANYIFMAKFHKATSDSEDDAEPTYHTDSIAEVPNYDTLLQRGSSPPAFQNPTYDRLMTTVSMLEGTITTLTQTVLSLQGSIGTLGLRLIVLEGDAHISTLTQTVSSLQGTIDNL
nr:hypothetical protein [Tanacetum cinerariifolium]